MPATATRDRKLTTATAPAFEAPELGEDGFPVKHWIVTDPETGREEERVFSLRPYTESEKTVYWNPIYIGQTMLWRAQEKNDWGVQPVIQRETWVEGKFAPRNDWERYMTEEYLRTLPGGNPAKWQGYVHPDNEPGQPPHVFRCSCGWPCGNWVAFRAHQKYLTHTGERSE
jgi:hypothetical protein